jgi:catechol 2,3-dioxygenase-like lactoylglutathione lyase family enzyme
MVLLEGPVASSRAVRFYTEVLGLKLQYRFGDHWASLELGRGLSIGLHPGREGAPASGKGTMSIGLELEGSINDAVRALEARGVTFHGIDRGKSGAFAHFVDPDGNSLYLAELNWGHVEGGEGRYQG